MSEVTTPEGIAFAQLISIKGAVHLEIKGLTSRGRSAYSVAKEKYGLKGNRQSVYDQLQAMVDNILGDRHEKAQD